MEHIRVGSGSDLAMTAQGSPEPMEGFLTTVRMVSSLACPVGRTGLEPVTDGLCESRDRPWVRVLALQVLQGSASAWRRDTALFVGADP